MSQYSPTVAPEYFGTNGSELAAALTQILHERRAQQQSDDAHALSSGSYIANGGRYGSAPTRQEPLTLPTDAGIPTSLAGAFDAASRGGPAPAHHPMWDEGSRGPRQPNGDEDPDATGGGWGNERPRAPGQDTPPGGALAGALQARMAGQPAPPALTHGGGAPGSFQPALAGFAPAMPVVGAPPAGDRSRGPAVGMTVPDDADRYVQADPEHYIDTRQTKQGQSLAQAMAMMDARNAGAYDRAALGANTRLTTTRMNNDTRQNISDDRIASEDDRAADAIDSRDRIAALGRSLRVANGGSITATAKEANAQKAAASLLSNYGGDYNKALDALEHTPEGQELAQSGVTRRHLYVALGQAEQHTTDQVVRIGGRHPEKVVARVQAAGAAVRAGAGAAGSAADGGGAAAPVDPVAEKAKYDAAVAQITKNFTGQEQADRLARARTIYEGRVKR